MKTRERLIVEMMIIVAVLLILDGFDAVPPWPACIGIGVLVALVVNAYDYALHERRP